MGAGRYLRHEHPATATSWMEESAKRVVGLEGVIITKVDQCRFGLNASDGWGEGPAMEPTRFMTNRVRLVTHCDQLVMNCGEACGRWEAGDGR